MESYDFFAKFITNAIIIKVLANFTEIYDGSELRISCNINVQIDCMIQKYKIDPGNLGRLPANGEPHSSSLLY